MNFSIGDDIYDIYDPVSVLEGRDLLNAFECWDNGEYYSPPASFEGLAKMRRAAAVHGRCVESRAGHLTLTYVDNPILPKSEFRKLAPDFVTFGNGILERIITRGGQLSRLVVHPMIRVRRGLQRNQFFWIESDLTAREMRSAGGFVHLTHYDIEQEIYGMPDYLGGMQSVLLNEESTLFRRKYYKNGTHMGSIFYINDPSVQTEDAVKFEEALKKAKGVGNFRSMLIRGIGSMDGEVKDPIKVIPVGELTAKDEFLNVKTLTQQDALTAHGMPMHMASVIPENQSGYGDTEKLTRGYIGTNLATLQEEIAEQINGALGRDVVKFDNNKILEYYAGGDK